MFGKICKIIQYNEEVEGVLLDIQKSGVEMLASIIWIEEKFISTKLRFGYFYIDKKDISKIKVLDKSFKPYFDAIFEDRVDHDDLYNLRQEWK